VASVLRRTPPDLPAILALDLGTMTGWALRVDGRLESGAEDFSLVRGESPGMRYVNFNNWLRTVTAPILDAAGEGRLGLLAYEQAHHRGGAATEVLSGLTTRVQEFCARFQLNHVAVHTASLKKFVTGKGNADKAMMASAIYRRGWLPAAEWARSTTETRTADELDAIGLLHYVEAKILGGGPPL
jgi:crossover junction endodeoxyribonuclease RuvC